MERSWDQVRAHIAAEDHRLTLLQLSGLHSLRQPAESNKPSRLGQIADTSHPSVSATFVQKV